MDDWKLDSNFFNNHNSYHNHYQPPTTSWSTSANIMLIIGCLPYIMLIIGCLLIGSVILNVCCKKKAVTNKVKKKNSICRCVLYTLLSSIILLVIFTIFGFSHTYLHIITSMVNYSDALPRRHFHQNSIMSSANVERKIGFSVGGAKDINTFRDNINNNYLPLSTSITYEGLFYDYYFDTNVKQITECKQLFCPTYSTAITTHPLNTNDVEYYLSVGLNSNINIQDFKRKKLNLVIVLDISGSMSSSFNRYYYDNKPNVDNKDEILNDDWSKSKIDVAKESIIGLIHHLNKDDRFGMAVFETNGYIAKPLSLIAETDINKIKAHIMELQHKGSTNFEAGYKRGTELFDILGSDGNIINDPEYENRIIFLTDAMPNTGNIYENSLLGLANKNANDINGRIYSTFIGIGVDFNTDLIESITKIRGANYYAVHSCKEFMKRMDKEFEYMVTPLVFNLELKLSSSDVFEIEEVYGSPEADQSTGYIMKVNTLFPSTSNEQNEVKGGITLLKLKQKKDINSTNLQLMVSYEDRNGEKHSNEVSIVFNSEYMDNIFENNGIRKAVLLSRYTRLMKKWINESSNVNDRDNDDRKSWERVSIPLQVNDKYKKHFFVFHGHFMEEMKVLNDETLQKETDILHKLALYENKVIGI